ncbi:MAG TPA: hypothetical protein VJZ76_10570 [Thermoanaerobaculia bacterium]|nr:hypothetical protein [Thermoanaerobaculia bacterium]
MSTWAKRAALIAVVVTLTAAVGILAFARYNKKKPESFARIAGIAGEGYQCKAPTAIDAASAWPVPHDAIRHPDEIYTTMVRAGAGTRRPRLGSGQVVVLCVTYYNRDGSVRERDPAAIVELDPGPSPWSEVAAMMVEGEIRRVWMPDRESPGGTMIADFEMEPWPRDALSPSDLRRRKK